MNDFVTHTILNFIFQSSLAVTLREVRPTVFLGVPRVWEKIVERIKTVGHESSNLTKKIATWAKSVGLKGNYSRMNGYEMYFTIGSLLKQIISVTMSALF